MICTLTIDQHKQLFKKVFVDLSANKDFTFNIAEYIEDFYDMVNEAVGDPEMALSYISLLPQNIRVNVGINKVLSSKYAAYYPQIVELENRFSNIDGAIDYMSQIKAIKTGLANIQQEMQQDSLRPVQNTDIVEEHTEPDIKIEPATGLSDLTFENRTSGEQTVSPDKKFYADVKRQLIKNAKQDGTSFIEGFGLVKLQVVSTQMLEPKDLYPDTLRQLQGSDQERIERINTANQKGAVLMVTDLDNKIIYFDENVKPVDRTLGKPAYFLFRDPQPNKEGKFVPRDIDKLAIDQISRDFKMTIEEVTKAYYKKLGVYKNIRKFINEDPKKNRVDINITGGFMGIPVRPDTAIKTPLSALSLGTTSFFPQEGVEAKGQHTQSYYFEIPNPPVPIQIKKPDVTKDFAEKLASLMFDPIFVEQRGNKYPLSPQERIKLFEQFFYTSPITISFKPNEDGSITMRKFGEVVSLTSPEEYKKTLVDYLTRLQPAKELKKEFVGTRKVVTDIKDGKNNYVYKLSVEGKDRYFLIQPAQLEISKANLKNNAFQDFTIDSLADNLILRTEQKPYTSFIKSNFVINYPLDSSGNIQTVNAVLNFDLPVDSMAKIQPNKKAQQQKVEEVAKTEVPSSIANTELVEPLTKKMSAKDFLAEQRKKNPDVFNKIVEQKGLEATEAQIEDAMKWYSKHPMNAYFPFESAFGVINLNNPNSIATWTTSGITLYKASDYSDLYHEAWHGFTQGFMSKDEKGNLYNELRKKTGTFIDYVGKRVYFNKATELQLEEFLAEDFREYMLTDGKQVLKNSPVRNSIFRRIFNFLKSLFGDVSYNETIIDDNVNQTVKDLYEKLRLGDLTNFSFSVENRNFNTLNKGIGALNKMDSPSLSFENSKLMLDTINSLFSEYADVNNSYSETEGDQGPKQTYKYTTKLFETPKGLSATYDYVKWRLSKMHEAFEEQYKATPTQELLNKMDLLKWSIRSFGDTANLMRNTEESGVVGYHLANSDYIPSFVKEELQEEVDLAGRETEGKNYYDRGGNETSIFDLANKEIGNILKGLPKYDSSDNIVINKLGVSELNPFKETFAHIAKTVQNLSTPQKMYEALEKETENYPTLKHLLEKLGPVEYAGQSLEEVNNWTRFWQTFNKYRIVLIQTTMNTVRGERRSDVSYEITIGNAVADFRRIGRQWESLFEQEQNNPFIKNNQQGNYLDIGAVIKKYPTKADITGKEFEFLRDIGIALKDTKTIRNELKREINSGSIKLGGIYNNISILNEKGITVRRISKYINQDDKLGISGEAGANGNYGKLQKIQYRFGDEDSDFMVVNAAGDPQSEFSQNTTLTQILKYFNEANSYAELISMPQMSYLNRTQNEPGKPYNTAVDSSILINSLFNMSEPGGPKYPGAKIDVVNLSGLSQAVNGINIGEGSISTELDEYSKLIQDFHVQLMVGKPELTRHAGKKTSLGVFVDNIRTYAGKETAYLYIDTADFAVQMGDISKGYGQGLQIMMPYVISEVKRINYAKYLLTEGANVNVADFGAIERAAEFSKFSGVLSQDTQEKLLGIKGDIDAYMKSAESVELRNQIENDIIEYFGKQYKKVEKKISEAEYISPSLYETIKNKLKKNGNEQWAYDVNVRQALINSFIWNNWINHFEEGNILYGDPSLYKNEQDFFKRNTALNSTGDILRNDQAFQNHVNNVLGKPLAAKLGVDPSALTYNGILNTAVVSDIEIPSAYQSLYKEALSEAVIDKAYGNVNEADAAAFVSYDTYRIIRNALGKWDQIDEDLYQKELNGESIKDVTKFPAVVKMGYYGPLETSYLPLQALHKFALFPLIPSVIKGTNLELLHNKMMTEGIDYMTFKSGSKISTITTKGQTDTLYSDTQKRTLSDKPFTKNPIYVDFLKDQVEASTKFKGKVSFFSQLRKLIDTGLMENGVPVDFKGGKANWDKLSIPEQMQAPKKFKMRYEFLHNLDKLQQFKRQELLRELGWKMDKDGKPTGDIKSLLELISRELKRRDFPEHTWQFIQTIKDNQVKNSLDISQFAEQIEGVVVAVINKRLVNYKVNGEQLVQVAGTGFENLAFAYGENRKFEKPTAEDLAKYGTNDLPTYHKKADGTTAAAKVKIAIQGQFKNLLQLEDVKSKAKELKTTPLNALNSLLRDEAWLNTGENRRLITMIGARIPTQGLNSMEFVEIYEFLPEEAGSIIIAPSEITAKSGTDYDYDKLPMMMPNIKMMGGEVTLAKEYTRKEALSIYSMLVDYGINKLSLQGTNKEDIRKFLKQERFDKFEDAIIKMLGDDYLQRLVDVVKEDQKLSDFEDFYERLNGSAAIENAVIASVKNILADPDNFTNLIRPNSTELVEPIAKEIMAPLVTDPDLLTSKSKGTAIYEPLKNLQIHQSNTIGKRTLGIVAIENTFKTIFNGIGMRLNSVFTKGNGKKKYRAEILLPHNTVKDGDKNAISLSGLKDASGENDISNVISQLMNGTVDVERDDWVSFIQMNEEVAPVMLFLADAGVPIKDIIYFVSQPLIRQYVTEQRLYASSFADVLGKKSENPKATRISARNSILSNVAYDFQIGEKLTDSAIYDQTVNETKDVKTFDRDTLLNNLKDYASHKKRGLTFKPTQLDRQTFLHYLELENMSKKLQELKLAANVDTNTSNTLFEMEDKVNALNKVQDGNLYPKSVVEKLKLDSAISPYFIQKFASDIFGRLFPMRNNKIVNQYISDLGFPKEMAALFKDKEQMVRTFKNDLISYIFQNSLRKFSLANTITYKNNTLKVVEAEDLPHGAIVRGDQLIVDKLALEMQYLRESYVTDEGLSLNTFRSQDEYEHYVIERESLRPLYNLSSIKNDLEYQSLLKKNLKKADLREEGQTDDQFKEKVEKISYDEWLRNKALYNIMNPWIMFRSGASVANKLMKIIEKHPSVRENYSLIKGTTYSEGREGFRNLRLAGGKIDGITAEIFHENLQDLANESKIKVDNPVDNKYISDYFKNFSAWMFMQSGLNQSPFSFNKVISQEAVTNLLNGPYKEALSELGNEGYLDNFYRMFVDQNANKSSRLRSKNYLRNLSLESFEGQIAPPVTEEQEETKVDTTGQEPVAMPQKKVVVSNEELTDLLSKCYK